MNASAPVALSRTVRICVNDTPAGGEGAWGGGERKGTSESSDAGHAHNSYAGAPAMSGAGRYYEFSLVCIGEPDPATGYLISIKEIDDALRSPVFMHALRAACDSGREPAASIAHLAGVATETLHQGAGQDGASSTDSASAKANRARIGVRSLRWQLTPFYSVEAIMQPAQSKPAQTQHILLRQRFDFAASHRLHTNHLSDDENRRIFGKCNNPRGHGHNYKVEVCVSLDASTSTHAPATGHLTLAEFERLVDTHVIQRFDHKHLNEDTPEFDESRGGVMPSVENIAAVCYRLLEAPLASRLVSVTVWETEKTSATYPA